jgi:hypothetical protein
VYYKNASVVLAGDGYSFSLAWFTGQDGVRYESIIMQTSSSSDR